MKYLKGKIAKLLVDYFGADVRRIDHALEVLKHVEIIAAGLTRDKSEVATDPDYDVLIAVALLHDIGIKTSEEKLGYNNGQTQEEYGPPVARDLLKSIDFPPDKILKVCEIIGNHHSKTRYDYVELIILKEADGIVNRMTCD
jgi:HD superfamily phosphodiesterase